MKASVKNWLTNLENGNITNFSEKVLKEVKDNTRLYNYEPSDSEKKGISTYALRESTGMSHQTLTSRLSQLNDEGLIRVIGQVEINEKHYSVYEFIFDDYFRKVTITLRKKEKFAQWLKKADSFSEFMEERTRTMIYLEQTRNNEN